MTRYSQETKELPRTAVQDVQKADEGIVRRRGTALWCVFTSLLLAAAIGLCVFVSIQVRTTGYVDIGGFSLFRVVTGSMEPTITTGELLLCRTAGIESIAVGEIVCYRTEISKINDAVITHRVVEIGTDKNGSTYLVTQGDANLVADAHLVQSEDLIGRVVWYSGKESVLNDVLSFLTSKIGFLTCIVLPVMLAAGLILQSSVKNLYQEIAYFKRELASCAEEAEREAKEENGKAAVLQGYTVLTQEDYEELLRKVQAELIEELRNNAATEESAPKGGTTE